MKAKINKTGILEINTESELEEFAIEQWIDTAGLSVDHFKVNNDYDKIQDGADYEKMFNELMKKYEISQKENSELRRVNDYFQKQF